MTTENILKPLDKNVIEEQIERIENSYQLISVTLVTGDIILGGRGNYGQLDEKVITLGFNTNEGRRFGHSYAVEIPKNLIADIQLINFDESSTPKMPHDDSQLEFMREVGLAQVLGKTDDELAKLRVQDYPNPLAKIVCAHNLQVIRKHDLSIHSIMEMSLSQDGISPEGIYLESDFLFYADWEYFSRQISGGFSVGAGLMAKFAEANITKDLSPSLTSFLLKRLKNSVSEQIRRKVAPEIARDILIQGCILMSDPPDDTEIEGEKCVLALCVSSNREDGGYDCPVLVKKGMLKFPLEFLRRINSVLVFYGEFLPVPLNLMGRQYDKTLLARAIAYIGE